MRVQDLRIGNIIRHNVKDTESDTGFCEPNESPITEDDMWFFCDGGKEFRIYLADSPKDNSLHYNAGNEWYPEIAEFKFIHQLQNLYFALTGEELKLQ